MKTSFFRKVCIVLLVGLIGLTQFDLSILANTTTQTETTTENTTVETTTENTTVETTTENTTVETTTENTTVETTQVAQENSVPMVASFFGLVPVYNSQSRVVFFVDFVDDNGTVLADNVPFYTGGGVAYPTDDAIDLGDRLTGWSDASGNLVDLSAVTVNYTQEELEADPFVAKEVTLRATYISEVVTYTRQIFYLFEDATEDPTDNQEAYPHATVVIEDGTEESIVSPAIPGSLLSDSSQTVVTLNESSNLITYVYYTQNNNIEVGYQVRHIYEGINSEAAIVETQQLTGVANTLTNTTAQEKAGFSLSGAIPELLINADGSTVVEINYSRNSYFITFDSNGGNHIEAMEFKYNETLTTPVATREGYTFVGFKDTDGVVHQTLDGTMGAENQHYTLEWLGSEANYQVVYWVENANALPSVDMDTQPDSVLKNTDQYSYVKTTVQSGLAGTVPTINSASLDKMTVNYVTGTSEFAKYSWSDVGSKTINGDGTTVVNVYFTRELYTITFTGHNDIISSNTKINMNGETYNAGDYVINAKYQQDITGLWPNQSDVKLVGNLSSKNHIGWVYRVGGTFGIVNSTDRFVLAADLLPPGNNVYVADLISHFDYTTKSKVTYYSEKLDHESSMVPSVMLNGVEYIIMQEYSQEYNDESSNPLESKSIEGFKVVYNNEDKDDQEIYYDRNLVSISYNVQTSNEVTGNYVAPTYENVKYGDLLSKYVPTEPTRTDGYEFGGWYYEAECKTPVDFVSGIVPNAVSGEVVFFAKWIAPSHDVIFNANGGSFDVVATAEVEALTSTTVSVEHDKIVGGLDDVILTHPNAVFNGWFIDTNNNGIKDASEKGYSLNDQVVEGKEVTANWIFSNSISYTVRHVLEGTEEIYEIKVSGNMIGDKVNVNALTSSELMQKGWPSGYYTADLSTVETTLNADNQIITFTYTRAQDASFQYQIVCVDEHNQVISSNTMTTDSMIIIAQAPGVSGYTLTSNATHRHVMSFDESKNVITFQYAKVINDAEYNVEFYSPEGVKVGTDVQVAAQLGNKVMVSEVLAQTNVADQINSTIVANPTWDTPTNTEYDYKIIANGTTFELHYSYTNVFVDYYSYTGELVQNDVSEVVGSAPSLSGLTGLQAGTTFKYWANTLNGTQVNAVAKDTTALYAVVSHEITFMNGSTVYDRAEFFHDEKGTFPTINPTNGPRLFVGWSTVDGDATHILESYTVSEPKTLYAIYRDASLGVNDLENSEKEYDGLPLVFDENSIELKDKDGNLTTADQVTYEKWDANTNTWVEVTLEEVKATDVADSNKFKVTIEKDGYTDLVIDFELTISPRKVDIVIANDKKTYGEVDKAGYQSYTMPNQQLVTGEEIDVNIMRTNSEVGSVGFYEDVLVGKVVAVGSTKLENYIFNVIDANYTIEAADLTLVSVGDGQDLTQVYDGTALTFSEAGIELFHQGVEVSGFSVEYYADAARTQRIVSNADIQIINVADSKEIFLTIKKDNYNDIYTSVELSVTRRPVMINIASASTTLNNALTEAQIETLGLNALAQATTSEVGSAIVNSSDLVLDSTHVDSTIFNTVLHHQDVVSLTFEKADGTLVTPENLVPNIEINDNYEVVVAYGDVFVSMPVIVEPEVSTPSTTTTTASSTTTTGITTTQTEVEANTTTTQTTVQEETNSSSNTQTTQVTDALGDEETPLFAAPSNWSLVNLVATFVTILISLVLLVGTLRSDKEGNEENPNVVKNHKMLRVLSLAFAMLAFILFIFTQDVTLPMEMVDNWTIYFVLITVAQVVMAVLSKREVSELELETE